MPLEDVRVGTVAAWSVLVETRDEKVVAMIVPTLGDVIVGGGEVEKDKKSETRELGARGGARQIRTGSSSRSPAQWSRTPAPTYTRTLR